jgi:hypothetical protein
MYNYIYANKLNIAEYVQLVNALQFWANFNPQSQRSEMKELY